MLISNKLYTILQIVYFALQFSFNDNNLSSSQIVVTINVLFRGNFLSGSPAVLVRDRFDHAM